jgi:transposase-like protein
MTDETLRQLIAGGETLTVEFKQEAVRLLNEQRLPRSQVARNLGIDPETLRRWAGELASDKPNGGDAPSAARIGAAERKRAATPGARHPKKAIGIFSSSASIIASACIRP